MCLCLILVQTEKPGPTILYYFTFAISLAGAITFILLRLRIWLAHSRAVFLARPASLQPGPSAFQVLWDSTSSLLMVGGVGMAVVVTALEYGGHHDLVVLALDLIVRKMGKLVIFLLTE